MQPIIKCTISFYVCILHIIYYIINIIYRSDLVRLLQNFIKKKYFITYFVSFVHLSKYYIINTVQNCIKYSKSVSKYKFKKNIFVFYPI